ncbi:MAG TPA: trypsin-like peptidase domain-containing protein, partial [Phenylobacterium sp.]|nr:trypsin-like peptidase domain-containing protein [Phenylobacterium sp.]
FWSRFGVGVPRERVEGSLGSGVIVRSDGVIVTNNHVIEGGQEITVALSDRRGRIGRSVRHQSARKPGRTGLAELTLESPCAPIAS